jgi:hypothetical protein
LNAPKEDWVMTIRRAIASLTVAAVLAMLIAVPTAARSGTAVTIILTRAPDFTEAGWSASGAFTDEGEWTTGKAVEIESPVAFIVAAVWTTQVGDNGTFEMTFQGREGTPAGHPFGGTWQFTRGTGAYAGLHGGGTWSEADDLATGEHVFTVIGSVH